MRAVVINGTYCIQFSICYLFSEFTILSYVSFETQEYYHMVIIHRRIHIGIFCEFSVYFSLCFVTLKAQIWSQK